MAGAALAQGSRSLYIQTFFLREAGLATSYHGDIIPREHALKRRHFVQPPLTSNSIVSLWPKQVTQPVQNVRQA